MILIHYRFILYGYSSADLQPENATSKMSTATIKPAVQQNILHRYVLQQTSLTAITSSQISRTANAIQLIGIL